jgi:hypothetical protein
MVLVAHKYHCRLGVKVDNLLRLLANDAAETSDTVYGQTGLFISLPADATEIILQDLDEPFS